MANAVAKRKSMSKTELVSRIAEQCELTKADVKAVLEAMEGEIGKSLKARGPGVFTIPGIVKIERRKVPARKARKGVPNPFRPGELMDIPAKPATTKIKVRPLKNLKNMA